MSEDQFFCDSFKNCAKKLLNMIGYYSLSTILRDKIDQSINNLTYLLKLSFIESIKLCVTVFGLVSFSIPGLEKLYNYGKDKAISTYNSVTSTFSGLANKLVEKVTNLQNISPSEFLLKLKKIVLDNKILISLSTTILVIITIKTCSSINKNNGLKKFSTDISFNEILVKYLNFFPFNTELGRIVIEYTGLFMDSARDIVNKIISQIDSICLIGTKKFRLLNNTNSGLIKMTSPKLNKVDYLKHQITPIEYLTKKCVNQDGLFLFHTTGTGKSLTSLGIAQNIGLPIILFCPNQLISQWKKDYLEMYQSFIPSVEIYSINYSFEYLKDKHDSWYQNHTLILDEVHNLAKLSSDQKYEIMNKLIKFRKRIVLTATPIYLDTLDITIPMNIVQGEFMFPLDENEFRKKYYSLKLMKSLFLGWTEPILYLFNTIMIKLRTVGRYLDIFSMLITDPTIDKLLTLITDIIANKLSIHGITVILLKNDLALNSIKALISIFVKIVTLYLKFTDDDSNSYTPAMEKENTQTLFNFLIEYAYSRDNWSNSKIGYTTLGNDQISNAMTKQIIDVILGTTVSLIIWLISIVIKCIFSDAHLNNGHEEYYYPNFRKISQNISNSVSYFNLNKLQDKNYQYPKVVKKNIHIDLNDVQTYIYLAYLFTNLNREQYMLLGLIENKEKLLGFTFNQKDKQSFETYGSFIGNICTIINKKDKTNVNSILDVINYKNNTYFELSTYCKFDKISPKFLEIEKIYNTNSYRKFVIYSNSSLHSKLLSAYLTSKNIINYYLDNNLQDTDQLVQQYYSQIGKSILILDSQFYEGISILRTDVFIILESNHNVSKTTQIMGRCIRLNSHKIGAKIEIINLTSTLNTFTKFYEKMLYWSMENKRSVLSQFKSFRPDLQTPDKINYEFLMQQEKFSNEFLNSISKRTIENIDENINCKQIKCEIKPIYEKSDCAKINKNYLTSDKKSEKDEEDLD